MSDDRLLVLLSRKWAGEASDEELEELAVLMDANAESRRLTGLLEGLQLDPVSFLHIEDEEQARQKWRKRINDRIASDNRIVSLQSRLNRKKWFMAAAAVVFILAASLWVFHDRPAGKTFRSYQNKVVTRPGSRTKIRLPDGSRAWLNVGSKLTYADEFAKGNRKLTLDGEAFFEVAKDAAHPFVIHTKAMDIRVLGTAFNVKAYADDPSAEAVLVNGRIEVTVNRQNDRKVILKPKEKLVVLTPPASGNRAEDGGKRDNPPALVKILPLHPEALHDTSYVETAWVSNRLEFYNERFPEVMRKFERWFDVKIEVADTSLDGEQLSGSFKTENVEEALKALQFSTPFKYSKIKDQIIITGSDK